MCLTKGALLLFGFMDACCLSHLENFYDVSPMDVILQSQVISESNGQRLSKH